MHLNELALNVNIFPAPQAIQFHQNMKDAYF